MVQKIQHSLRIHKAAAQCSGLSHISRSIKHALQVDVHNGIERQAIIVQTYWVQNVVLLHRPILTLCSLPVQVFIACTSSFQ